MQVLLYFSWLPLSSMLIDQLLYKLLTSLTCIFVLFLRFIWTFYRLFFVKFLTYTWNFLFTYIFLVQFLFYRFNNFIMMPLIVWLFSHINDSFLWIKFLSTFSIFFTWLCQIFLFLFYLFWGSIFLQIRRGIDCWIFYNGKFLIVLLYCLGDTLIRIFFYLIFFYFCLQRFMTIVDRFIFFVIEQLIKQVFLRTNPLPMLMTQLLQNPLYIIIDLLLNHILLSQLGFDKL